jgi:hypothetical protein
VIREISKPFFMAVEKVIFSPAYRLRNENISTTIPSPKTKTLRGPAINCATEPSCAYKAVNNIQDNPKPPVRKPITIGVLKEFIQKIGF